MSSPACKISIGKYLSCNDKLFTRNKLTPVRNQFKMIFALQVYKGPLINSSIAQNIKHSFNGGPSVIHI